ncbi:MAG: hypothetical protein OXT67_11690 [Zetaproteobacteria bacterium]|nr:hypothetical protein [Zetaproteobacteria bacterium]
MLKQILLPWLLGAACLGTPLLQGEDLTPSQRTSLSVPKLAMLGVVGSLWLAHSVQGEGFTCRKALITKINATHSEWECTDTRYHYGPKCFVSTTKVYKLADAAHTMESAVAVAMSSLKAGDIILDGDGKPTEVLGIMHQLPADAHTALVTLKDLQGEEIVTLSPEHLLFTTDGTSFFADRSSPGTVLRGKQGDIEVGSSVQYRVGTGENVQLIAPLTTVGHMLVGEHRIAASCFAHISSHYLAQAYQESKHALHNWRHPNEPVPTELSSFELKLLHALRTIKLAR